jgi:hypothetical protein
MIEKQYSKDETHVKQKLSVKIDADKKEIFHYLATTEGISLWFPQLSIEDKLVLFDMGDGIFEKMQLLDYQTNDHISYEWATGQIEFKLESATDGTQLILEETLPVDFAAIPEDFTGWFVQMQNIKSVAETGSSATINREEILAVKEEIKTQI